MRDWWTIPPSDQERQSRPPRVDAPERSVPACAGEESRRNSALVTGQSSTGGSAPKSIHRGQRSRTAFFGMLALVVIGLSVFALSDSLERHPAKPTHEVGSSRHEI